MNDPAATEAPSGMMVETMFWLLPIPIELLWLLHYRKQLEKKRIRDSLGQGDYDVTLLDEVLNKTFVIYHLPMFLPLLLFSSSRTGMAPAWAVATFMTMTAILYSCLLFGAQYAE